MTRIKNIISFDVEEYFQVEAACSTGIVPEMWGNYQRRVNVGVDKILTLLEETSTRATFFVLGWVAKENPEIVKRIAFAGHEIASHGMSHQMLTRLSWIDFGKELVDSKALLEDMAGKAVKGFRAPTFSIMHETAWAIDELVKAGYEYDSSVFPVHHDRYGVPEAPRWAHIAKSKSGGGKILEIPPLTMKMFGGNMPIGGGGYLRLFPIWLMGRAINKANSAGQTGMIYLHPWELDPDQPDMGLGLLSRFRHRVNLGRTYKKLRWLLTNFEFTATEEILGELRGRANETFDY